MEWNGMEWNGMEWSGMEWNVSKRPVVQMVEQNLTDRDTKKKG